jgi:hypothetical protein
MAKTDDNGISNIRDRWEAAASGSCGWYFSAVAVQVGPHKPLFSHLHGSSLVTSSPSFWPDAVHHQRLPCASKKKRRIVERARDTREKLRTAWKPWDLDHYCLRQRAPHPHERCRAGITSSNRCQRRWTASRSTNATTAATASNWSRSRSRTKCSGNTGDYAFTPASGTVYPPESEHR